MISFLLVLLLGAVLLALLSDPVTNTSGPRIRDALFNFTFPVTAFFLDENNMEGEGRGELSDPGEASLAGVMGRMRSEFPFVAAASNGVLGARGLLMDRSMIAFGIRIEVCVFLCSSDDVGVSNCIANGIWSFLFELTLRILCAGRFPCISRPRCAQCDII